MKFLLSFVTFLLCCGILAFGGYQMVVQSDFEGMGAAFEEAITNNSILPQRPVGPENPTCEAHFDKDGDYICDNCGELVGLPEGTTQNPGPSDEPVQPEEPGETTKPTTPSTPSATTKPTTSTTKPTTITRPTTSGTKPTTITRPTTTTTTKPGSSTNNTEPNPPVDEPCVEHVDYNIDNICDNCGADLGQIECVEHVDYDTDYYCDNCGAELDRPCEDHEDANGDYFCDYCAAELERPCVDHEDNDGNYYCDYCAIILEHEHIDEDNSRKCDICNEPIAITEEEMEEDVRNAGENITEETAPIVNKTLSDSIGSFLDQVLGPDWFEHECESVCETCGKCLDNRCVEDACTEKCQGHGINPAPEHKCESVCDECGKCLDSSCKESACKSKCKGHEPDDSDYNAPFIPEENPPEEDEDDDEPVKYDYKAMIKEATKIYTNNFVQETLAMKKSTEGKSEYEKLAIETKFYSDEAAGKQAFMNLILLSTSTTGALSEEEVIGYVSSVMRSSSCMKTVGEITETLYPLIERIQSVTSGFSDETKETIKNNIQNALSLYMNSADANAEYAQNYHDLANMLNITLD